MIEACADCRFRDALKGYNEEYEATAERARKAEKGAWNAGSWLIASLTDLKEGRLALDAEVRENLDQARESALYMTASTVFRNAEIKELARMTLGAAGKIDCAASGYDLAERCPRVAYLAVMQVDIMILGQTDRESRR